MWQCSWSKSYQLPGQTREITKLLISFVIWMPISVLRQKCGLDFLNVLLHWHLYLFLLRLRNHTSIKSMRLLTMALDVLNRFWIMVIICSSSGTGPAKIRSLFNLSTYKEILFSLFRATYSWGMPHRRRKFAFVVTNSSIDFAHGYPDSPTPYGRSHNLHNILLFALYSFRSLT